GRSEPGSAGIFSENRGVDGGCPAAESGCAVGTPPPVGRRPASCLHAVFVGLRGRAEAGVRSARLRSGKSVSRLVRAVPARARSTAVSVGSVEPVAADGTRSRRSRRRRGGYRTRRRA